MDNKNNNRLKTLLYAIDKVNRENQRNVKIASSGGTHSLTSVSSEDITPVIDIKNQSRYSYDYLKFDTLTSVCTLVMRIKEDII
jgi:hypothetical protein